MISSRRALLIAALILTGLYLFHTSHPPSLPQTGRERTLDAASKPDTAPREQSTGRTNRNPTSAWKSRVAGGHAKPAGQQALTGAGRGSLRDRLEEQFPYDVETKFPAYIWQTWKITPASGEFAENLRPAEASWTEKHPSFVHEVVTDDAAVHLMRYLYASVPTVLDAYDALPLPILKADFFRYLILLARGGIYSDIDTTVLKPAYEWVPDSVPRSSYGLVVGIEADPDRPDWSKWYSRRIQFCQWTIQAKAGHPVLVDVVATITEEALRRKKAGTLKGAGDSIVEFTGPALWTDRVFAYLNNEDYFDMRTSQGNVTWGNFTGMKEVKQVGDVVVLPITGFSPGVGQMGAGEYDDPMACVKHDFHGTWKPESERHIGPNANA